MMKWFSRINKKLLPVQWTNKHSNTCFRYRVKMSIKCITILWIHFPKTFPFLLKILSDLALRFPHNI
jgi:hypothetical protein